MCLGLRWSVRIHLVACVGSMAAFSQPSTITPRWQVRFSSESGGNAHESLAVPVKGEGWMVAVLAPGADVSSLNVRHGSRQISAEVRGFDPISRLVFFSVQDPSAVKPVEWVNHQVTIPKGVLYIQSGGQSSACEVSGWEKQVGGKILPLALLRVAFSQSRPSAGSPVFDASGKVAGIVFQAVGSRNECFVIPAEAVDRVERDILRDGLFQRGWLGLALRSDSKLPLVSRVLPGSPAAAAGIRVNDVLVSVGVRQISDYADAANAFFYLLPGEPVLVRLRRGQEMLEYSLTPEKAPQ